MGWQRVRWLDGIIKSMDMILSKFWEISEGQGRLVCCSSWGVTNSWTRLSDWTATIYIENPKASTQNLLELLCYFSKSADQFLKLYVCVCIYRHKHNKMWKCKNCHSQQTLKALLSYLFIWLIRSQLRPTDTFTAVRELPSCGMWALQLRHTGSGGVSL